MIPVLRAIAPIVEPGTFDRIQGIDDDLLTGAMIHELCTACVEVRGEGVGYLMQANDMRAPGHFVIF